MDNIVAGVRESTYRASLSGERGKLNHQQAVVDQTERVRRLIVKRKPSKVILPPPYTGPRLTEGKSLHCYFCDCSYKYKSRLVRHIQKHLPPQYECGQCGKEFHRLDQLKKHLRLHSAPLQFKCQFCDFATKYSKSLQYHVAIRHGATKPKPTTLDPLSRTGTIPGLLNREGPKIEITATSRTKMKKKTKERSKLPPPYSGPREWRKGYFYCYYCPKEFQNKTSIKSHMDSHLPLEFFCKICGNGYSRLSSLQGHYRNHLSKKKFQCQFCTFNTKYPQSLAHHVKVSHSKTHDAPTDVPSLSCFHCGWTTKFKSRLVVHLKNHRPPLYKCKQCDYRTSTRKYLGYHVARSHNHTKECYKCSLCEFQSKSKAGLRRHTILHSNPPKRFECSFCGFQTRYSSSLKDHVVLHTGEKPYFCHLCNHTAALASAMATHFKTHGDFKTYKCPYCQFKSEAGCTFAGHLKVEHSNREPVDPSARDHIPHPCQICDEEFDTKEHLLEHMTAHPRERKFKCPHCEYATFLKPVLYEHIRSQHTDRKFECHYCDYKTRYKSGLKAHIEVLHEKRVAFNCRFCDYQSFRKRAVTKHEEVHFGEKKFACDECDFRTRQSGTLKNHKLLHTGGVPRPFKCEFCDYRGPNRALIKRHVQGVHATDRPFKCNFCTKTFKTQQTARLHEACHAGKTVLECSMCAYTTICGPSLRKHEERMHSSQPMEDELPDTFPNGRKKNYFFCKKCAYYACQKSSLTRHMKLFHPKRK